MDPQGGPQMARGGPKRPQDCPKRAHEGPRWPNMGPRWAQDGPRWARDSPRRAQDGPKMAPRWAQDGPKTGPRCSILGPCWAILGLPRLLLEGPGGHLKADFGLGRADLRLACGKKARCQNHQKTIEKSMFLANFWGQQASRKLAR